jgi:hypothetical protein
MSLSCLVVVIFLQLLEWYSFPLQKMRVLFLLPSSLKARPLTLGYLETRLFR